MVLRRAALAQRVAAKREARKGMRKKVSNTDDSESTSSSTTYQAKKIFERAGPSRLQYEAAVKCILLNINRVATHAPLSHKTAEPPTKTSGRRLKIPVRQHLTALSAGDLRKRDRERRSIEQLASRGFLRPSARKRTSDWTINRLRRLLGLAPILSLKQALGQPQDALIVAVDTECESHGLKLHVVELGVTILDTRDIAFEPPGDGAQNWIAKTKSYHWVVDATRRRLNDRMHSGLFAQSVLASAENVRSEFLSLIRNASALPNTGETSTKSRDVFLVGHSIANDVLNLHQTPGLALKLTSGASPMLGFCLARTLDTRELALEAIQYGARMISLRLGMLVNWLGVDPQYADGKNVVGTHNAANDAAYTMMAFLMLAVRWNEITQAHFKSGPLQIAKEANRSPQTGIGTYQDYLRRLLRRFWLSVSRRLTWRHYKRFFKRLVTR